MTESALIRAVQDAFWRCGELVMLHHTNPWELDEALEAFGYSTGPCVAQDRLGLDRVLARRTEGTSGPVLTRMVAEGRLGKVTGVGYYRYPGGGGAVIDPLIEDLIREEAWFGKMARSEVAPAVLVSQMHKALVRVCRDMSARSDWAEVLEKAVYFPSDKIAVLGL